MTLWVWTCQWISARVKEITSWKVISNSSLSTNWMEKGWITQPTRAQKSPSLTSWKINPVRRTSQIGLWLSSWWAPTCTFRSQSHLLQNWHRAVCSTFITKRWKFKWQINQVTILKTKLRKTSLWVWTNYQSKILAKWYLTVTGNL